MKYLVLCHCNSNKEFKKCFKKSNNSMILSYYDILLAQKSVSKFNEVISYRVVSTEMYKKLLDSLMKLSTTNMQFIYYFIDNVDSKVLFNLSKIAKKYSVSVKLIDLYKYEDHTHKEKVLKCLKEDQIELIPSKDYIHMI